MWKKSVLWNVLIIVVVGAVATASAQRPKPKVYGEFKGDKMYTLLPPDGIPAIMNPEYVTGKEAAAQMSANEPVMGLSSADDAVCFSTWQLDHHEIVNDVFNGTAIAATW